jgi:flagellar motor switch protein FliN
MRLLIVGSLKGQLTVATKMAMDKGATVTQADTIDQALAVLRSGRGADLLMVEVAIDIRALLVKLEAEHIHVPIVACGITNDARAAVDAIHAGAKEYIPLPPDAELIAAVLGRAKMDVGELLRLGPGTVLELDRKVGEAIDIYVNNRLVARGEVVVVEDRLGVTMTEIIKTDRA